MLWCAVAGIARAGEDVASGGTLINLWNDSAWKRFRNPTDALGNADLYVPAVLDGRRMTAPGHREEDARKIYFINEYTFTTDPGGAVYLVNISAFYREAHMEITVHLNGRQLAVFSPSDLPMNIKIADRIMPADKVTVAVRSTSAMEVSNVLSFALKAFKDGVPGEAIETLHPAAGEASPKRTYEGGIEPAYQARHDQQQARIAQENPRVIFAGDSITDGFSGTGQAQWALLKRFHPFNMGISGDWTHTLLWRLEHSVIDKAKPELIIVMIGTNDGAYSEEEVVKGIRAVVDCIRRKNPAGRILLHGILPRGTDFPPDNRYERINRSISGLADGKSVIYMDLSEHFLAPGRKVRADLLPDLLHPNSSGYEAWLSAITPLLEDLLPSP
jgi:beta-glucosidase